MKKRLVIALAALGVMVARMAAAAPEPDRRAGGLSELGGLPLCFAENAGQWPAATRFSASVPGATVEFGGACWRDSAWCRSG